MNSVRGNLRMQRLRLSLFIWLVCTSILVDVVSQNPVDIEIIEMETHLTLEETEVNWQTTIKLMVFGNIDSETSINFLFPTKISISEANMDGFPIPYRSTIQEESTSIELTPIRTISNGSIASLNLVGSFSPQKTEIEENKNLFRYSWALNFDVESFKLYVTLPRFSVINVEGETLNIFPSASTILTNGTHIIIGWENLSIDRDLEPQSIIVEFQTGAPAESNSNMFLMLFIGIVLGTAISAGAVYIFLLRTGKSISWLFTEVEQPEHSVEIRTVYRPVILKPQHRRIMEIIKEHEPCPQSLLIDTMGLSKSRISQYIKELENWELISKQKDGKENIIFLNFDLEGLDS